MAFHHRISEATLCFKKSFWLQRGFKDESIGGEAAEFMENREKQCLEISWNDIILKILDDLIMQLLQIYFSFHLIYQYSYVLSFWHNLHYFVLSNNLRIKIFLVVNEKS